MKLEQLREELAIDADFSEETLANLRDLQAIVGDREPTIHELAASGAYVRDVYQGI